MNFHVLVFNRSDVQGCDASVLLDGSTSGPGEQQAIPNLTLRAAAFKAINEIRALIDKACGRVVSCADVVAIAARDSVALVYIRI
jgi:peroxidase